MPQCPRIFGTRPSTDASVHGERGHKVPVESVRCLSAIQSGDRAKLVHRTATRMPDGCVCAGAGACESVRELERRQHGAGTAVARVLGMLKLIGSYAIAKLLGFGLVGALVIYALLSMLT